MVTLKKVLTDSSKARRRRCNILNIQMTIFAWVVEFIGFLGIIVGSVIVGHGSLVTTFLLQLFSMSIYFIFLPYVYLLNETSSLKNAIVDNRFYVSFITFVHGPHQESAHQEEEEE